MTLLEAIKIQAKEEGILQGIGLGVERGKEQGEKWAKQQIAKNVRHEALCY